MDADTADDLIPFDDVRVIRVSASAVLCRIGERSVWLPRGHISGRLWCAGNRGKLLIRRWVALDRHLIDLQGNPIETPPASLSRVRHLGRLHLV